MPTVYPLTEFWYLALFCLGIMSGWALVKGFDDNE